MPHSFAHFTSGAPAAGVPEPPRSLRAFGHRSRPSGAAA